MAQNLDDDNVDLEPLAAFLAYLSSGARAHKDIMRMSMSYHSLVGDMGSILSGGQKQRILLARALYKEPRLLFMDEGTANLDPELEAKVMETLRQLNITRIMVAHRAAAVCGDEARLRSVGLTTPPAVK
jgi:ABC-type bacteriocin/lantibiotic exporter with double-glycine peptidase domain